MKRDNFIWEMKKEIKDIEKKLEGHDSVFQSINLYLKSISNSLEIIASKEPSDGTSKVIEKIIEKPVIMGSEGVQYDYSSSGKNKKSKKKQSDNSDNIFIPEIDTSGMSVNKKAKKAGSEEMESDDVLGSVEKLGNLKK